MLKRADMVSSHFAISRFAISRFPIFHFANFPFLKWVGGVKGQFGEMGIWRNGKLAKWEDGEMGRWRNEKMAKREMAKQEMARWEMAIFKRETEMGINRADCVTLIVLDHAQLISSRNCMVF
jgi:hypothetical protein